MMETQDAIQVLDRLYKASHKQGAQVPAESAHSVWRAKWLYDIIMDMRKCHWEGYGYYQEQYEKLPEVLKDLALRA